MRRNGTASIIRCLVRFDGLLKNGSENHTDEHLESAVVQSIRAAIAHQVAICGKINRLPIGSVNRNVPRLLVAAAEFLIIDNHKFTQQEYIDFLKYKFRNTISADESFHAVDVLKLASLKHLYESILYVSGTDVDNMVDSAIDVFMTVEGAASFDRAAVAASVFPYEQRIIDADPSIYPFMKNETQHLFRLQFERSAVRDGVDFGKTVLKVCSESWKTEGNGNRRGGVIIQASPWSRDFPFVKPSVFLPFYYMIVLMCLGSVCAKAVIGLLNVPQIMFLRCEEYMSMFALVAVFYEMFQALAIRIFTSFSTRHIIDVAMSEAWTLGRPGKVVIAVPTILRSEARFIALLDAVRQRAAEFPTGKFVFVILSDLPDSRDGYMTRGEAETVAACLSAVDAVNEASVSDGGNPIVLLHRDRGYSERERRWMGAGRKAGKLEALNRLIVDGTSEFQSSAGELNYLKNAQYVVVLDESTKFNCDAVMSLLCCAVHPMNAPVVDRVAKRVLSGYGVVTPVTGAEASLQIARGRWQGGTVPDFSFQLWGQRSYGGKGIYDVAAAYHVLGSRGISEYALSHDIVEGAYLSTGYCPESIISEEMVRGYFARCARFERWVRGDVQNMLGVVGLSGRRWTGLPVFGVFLFANNVRKDVLPIAELVVLMMIFRWSGFLTQFASASIVLMPLLIEYLWSFIDFCFRMGRGTELYDGGGRILSLLSCHKREFVRLVTVPHRAVIATCAICVAVWRFHRGVDLLEWTATRDVTDRASIVKFHRLLMVLCSMVSIVALIMFGVRGFAYPVQICVLVVWSIGIFGGRRKFAKME